MQVEIELRHLPRFRVMNYLTQVGGTITETASVTGEGWWATIEALEPDRVGIVDVPRDRLVIEGDEHTVERVAAFMQHKVRQMRHGR
ncbi:MAG: hypothetical protein JXQ72_04345 [Anaerolineae bacterium]|nr:hypothetical protein [Anaerolineae bacterium]